MKLFDSKYLKEVLSALGLFPQAQEKASVSINGLNRAARWVLNDPSFTFGEYHPVPLRPIFGELGNNRSFWIQPQNLSLDESYLPTVNYPSKDSISRWYEKLKNAILSAKNETNLLTSLEFYASTISVSEKHQEIPLYDFIKLTAAVAHCIEQDNNKKIRLLGGNLSGIQTYLYEIVSKRASKLLKGRSFYLHILTDSLTEEVLQFFDLTPCHIVYNSGGGFYILLPDREGVLDDVQDLKHKISTSIFEAHKLALFVDFEVSEAFSEEITINVIWKELLDKLNWAKQRRLSDNPSLLRLVFSGPIEEGGDIPKDAITNEELDKDDRMNLGDSDDAIIVSRFTNKQIELGKHLRNAKYWISSKEEFPADLQRKAIVDPIGRAHLLLPDISNLQNLPGDVEIRMINLPNESTPFIFYGGNDIPIFDEETWIQYDDEDKEYFEIGGPVPFDFLAKGERLNRLGVLRMDVDNLGSLFSELGENASLVKYATISRSLDWFFKGYLNTIRSRNPSYKDKTIIIYAGGDDMFIVGRWLEVFKFAIEINNEFQKWSCGRLTLSGGMIVVPPKFPVMQGAKLAGEAEDIAKEYGKTTDVLIAEKNALQFLNETISWTEELPLLLDLKEDLNKMIKNQKGVERSIIRKINMHAISKREQEQNNQPRRWIWHLAYDFGQLSQRVKNQSKNGEDESVAWILKKLEEWRIAAATNCFPNQAEIRLGALEILQLAARLWELEDRTVNDN